MGEVAQQIAQAGVEVCMTDPMGHDGPVNSSPGSANAEGDSSRLYPRVTSFRFRRGSLTPGQQRNWEEHWDTYGRNVADEVVEFADLGDLNGVIRSEPPTAPTV